MSPSDLRWEWVHSGTPWYNPQSEVAAAVAEINAGINSGIRVCRSQGRDAFDIIDERAELEAYAASKGVVLSTALPSAALLDPNKQQAVTEDQNEEKDADGGGVANAFFGPTL
jgi:capsid protein